MFVEAQNNMESRRLGTVRDFREVETHVLTICVTVQS